MQLVNFVKSFVRNDEGQDLLEYALLVALIALVAIAAVEAAGVSWDVYNRFMKRYEKPIDAEKLVSVPPDLDLTPYRDEKDFALLHQLVKLER